MNLLHADLNLLCCLHALLVSGSVSRAADQLGVTQPAMSRSLARLRTLFNDPLFVRGAANRLAPTPRAEALRGPLEEILGRINLLVTPPEFSPEWAQARFRIAVSSSFPRSALNALLGEISSKAPLLELHVLPWQNDSCGQLAEDLDLAIGVTRHASPDLLQRKLFCNQAVCVMRAGHPLLEHGSIPDLATLAAWPHIAPSAASLVQTETDRALERAGLRRQVQLYLDDFSSLLDWLQHGNALLVTDRIAMQPSSIKDLLRILPMPDDAIIDSGDFAMYWSARWQNDPAHAWLRQTLTDAIRDCPAVTALPALPRAPLALPQPTEYRQPASRDERIYPVVGRFFPGRVC